VYNAGGAGIRGVRCNRQRLRTIVFSSETHMEGQGKEHFPLDFGRRVSGEHFPLNFDRRVIVEHREHVTFQRENLDVRRREVVCSLEEHEMRRQASNRSRNCTPAETR